METGHNWTPLPSALCSTAGPPQSSRLQPQLMSDVSPPQTKLIKEEPRARRRSRREAASLARSAAACARI
ncbi:unnamed protein product [Prunus armeniaca]